MAQKRQRLQISAMPWRTGLITAGQQTTIAEDALWQAVNVTAGLDGLLGKRPGLKRWGQTLKQPVESDSETTFFESWGDQSNWLVDDSSSGLVAYERNRGSIRTIVSGGTSNENYLLSYVHGGSTIVSDDWSIRLTVRIAGAPAYGDTTDPNSFSFQVISGITTRKEFAIFDDGLYYKQASDSKYVKIGGTDTLADGGWHVLELQLDGSASTIEVLVDDRAVSGSGFDSSLAETLSGVITPGLLVKFRWEVSGVADGSYSVEVGPVMYSTTADDPFEAKPIKAISDFRYLTPAGSSQSALVCAAGDYIYFDDGLSGIWKILLVSGFENVSFSTFRRTLVITDFSDNVAANLRQWDGVEDPIVLDDAPGLKFVTEHKQRLWGAGDARNPLRLYFSGDRQPNLWFSPSPNNIEDQIDAIEQAGYIEIPSKKGDRITGLFGDYYGRLLVFTRRGVWQVAGDGPTSFSLANISQDVGAENHECIAAVGNDIWFLGRYGVQALSAVDQFGDIQSSFPSAPISDKWTQDPSAVRKISRFYLKDSRLKYNPTQGLVYCAMPTTGESSPESIFIYNVNTKQWFGPWEIDSTAMENVEIGLPLIEVMAHGGASGEVLYTDQSGRRDVDAGYTMKLQSAYLNGRAMDPKLVGMMKTWKTLRLFLLPRGNWDFTVTARTDDDKPLTTVTRNQNQYAIRTLGDTEGDGTGEFRLSLDPDGRLHSREEMAVIEMDLSLRGRAMRFTIEQSGAGEDLVVQGFEAEFLPDGYEEE